MVVLAKADNSSQIRLVTASSVDYQTCSLETDTAAEFSRHFSMLLGLKHKTPFNSIVFVWQLKFQQQTS